MVICHVDDLLVMAEDMEKLSKLKDDLKRKLPAYDIGPANDFLGMRLVY